MSASSPTTSSRVRPFSEDDVDDVAALHYAVFPSGRKQSDELRRRQRQYFVDVFLRPPVPENRFPSLVYFEHGKVTGFLGSVSRPMLFQGERVLARVSSQFIVHPRSRGMAGLELLRAFFDGPQDLSIADEANGGSRRIWEALGGVTSLNHSLQWLCPLGPGRMAVWALNKARPLPGVARKSGLKLAAGVDRLASGLRVNPLIPSKPGVLGEDVEPAVLSAVVAEGPCQSALRSVYPGDAFEYLLGRANLGAGADAIKTVLLRSEKGRTVGWYIYRLSHTDISEVLQLFADRECAGEVLRHAAFHAASHGALALRGRCEPMLADALATLHWPCQWGPWLLVHSHNLAICQAFQDGDVFFSRLDGEWGVRFSDPSQ